MGAMDDLLRELREIDGQVTSDILWTLIEEHVPTRKRMMDLYERYKASEKGVPIFTRKVPDYEKVNNRLNNDFFSEIVDTKIGYFMGHPVVYSVDREAKNFDKINHELQDFNLRSNVEDLDSETAKYAAICGLGARLLYIDREGQERAMVVEPWECIFIYDRSISEPQYALRYYPIKVKENGVEQERYRVEWYCQSYVTFYIEGPDGEFRLDESEPVNPMVHLFGDIPLIAFPNNEEQQGDAEKILPLIDAYDRTVSDVNSEIESFRLAYMLFYGMEPDAETIANAQQTGAFGVGDPTDSKIEFLTKDLNDDIIEHHLDRLEANILRFAKSVNFTDEHFGGNLSGVAMKFKIFNLEAKCITAERKFMAALRQQFKVLATAWSKKGLSVDYTDLWFQFKRNLPLNLLDEAQTTAALRGHVSERTRLSLLSFIDDVEYEIEQMEMEEEVVLEEMSDGSGEGAMEGREADGEEGQEVGEGADKGVFSGA